MNLSQENWTSQLENDLNAVVIDVRTEEEYQEGIIAGAKNIDIYKGQEFIDMLETLDKSKNYYVYCKAGSRSEQACAILNQIGFENAFNLIGGFSNWAGPSILPH